MTLVAPQPIPVGSDGAAPSPHYRLRQVEAFDVATVNGEERHIPCGWRVERLDALADVRAGISAPKNFVEADPETTLPFVRVSGLSKTGKYVSAADVTEFLPDGECRDMPENTILIAKSGESIHQKYRRILTERAVVVGHIAGLIPTDDPAFLYHAITEYPPEDIILKKSTMPSLSLSDLKGFELVVPADPAQRESIATVLEMQNAVTEDLQAIVQRHETIFAALRLRLLSGELRLRADADGTPQICRNDGWKTVAVNRHPCEIPEDWQVADFSTYGVFKTGKSYTNVLGDAYPVFGSAIKPMNVRTSSPIHTGSSFILGRKGTINKPFKVDKPFWCVDTAMYYCGDTPALTRFLYQVAASYNWQQYSSGSTVPSLVQSTVNKVQFADPPAGEKAMICTVLERQETTLAKLKELADIERQKFQWLRRRLLSGKFEVTEHQP